MQAARSRCRLRTRPLPPLHHPLQQGHRHPTARPTRASPTMATSTIAWCACAMNPSCVRTDTSAPFSAAPLQRHERAWSWTGDDVTPRVVGRIDEETRQSCCPAGASRDVHRGQHQRTGRRPCGDPGERHMAGRGHPANRPRHQHAAGRHRLWRVGARLFARIRSSAAGSDACARRVSVVVLRRRVTCRSVFLSGRVSFSSQLGEFTRQSVCPGRSRRDRQQLVLRHGHDAEGPSAARGCGSRQPDDPARDQPAVDGARRCSRQRHRAGVGRASCLLRAPS